MVVLDAVGTGKNLLERDDLVGRELVIIGDAEKALGHELALRGVVGTHAGTGRLGHALADLVEDSKKCLGIRLAIAAPEIDQRLGKPILFVGINFFFIFW